MHYAGLMLVSERTSWRLDGLAAVKAGLIVGAVFLLLPQGSPWSALTPFSKVVMGRAIGMLGPSEIPLGLVALLHMLVAVIYAFIIATLVSFFENWRGILLGGLVALGLYLLNFGIVKLTMPALIGAEGRVAAAHLLFGLYVSACYLGLANRPIDRSVQP
jgi:hypothetical protein